MELRILGVHNLESADTRMEAHLIDGVLALDAGGLTRSLSFPQQNAIRAIILSHRHFDHVRDLPPLGLAVRDTGVTVEIYAIQDTVDFISSKLLDGSLYPDFLSTPSPESPTFRLNVVEFYKEFEVLGYTVLAVPVPHSVPAAGFQITSGDTKLFYTGDTGRGLSEAWEHVTPDRLLTEVTFGNENESVAIAVGHLTPALLEEALCDFQRKHRFLPRVIVSHISPPWEDAVRTELKELSNKMGIEITVPKADTVLML